ncbi:hypothetical protein [Nonomuraea sp. NEAU-A123]|uniref:hypothetical protein n=1 Tax=Nonomuraea sp. NEAU-A123 TaxID=2839649 RepID=UPI001BE4D578|nr:hypothetical protein [Nonomuraea sp. NEAU-A123]MBT2225241.1 hypothetical protein [Nonomuraea sp. NEAU-A123]
MTGLELVAVLQLAVDVFEPLDDVDHACSFLDGGPGARRSRLPRAGSVASASSR